MGRYGEIRGDVIPDLGHEMRELWGDMGRYGEIPPPAPPKGRAALPCRCQFATPTAPALTAWSLRVSVRQPRGGNTGLSRVVGALCEWDSTATAEYGRRERSTYPLERRFGSTRMPSSASSARRFQPTYAARRGRTAREGRASRIRKAGAARRRCFASTFRTGRRRRRPKQTTETEGEAEAAEAAEAEEAAGAEKGEGGARMDRRRYNQPVPPPPPCFPSRRRRARAGSPCSLSSCPSCMSGARHGRGEREGQARV